MDSAKLKSYFKSFTDIVFKFVAYSLEILNCYLVYCICYSFLYVIAFFILNNILKVIIIYRDLRLSGALNDIFKILNNDELFAKAVKNSCENVKHLCVFVDLLFFVGLKFMVG